jgi:glycosyltransferase involved in cell wall biosynthesis
MKKIYAVHLLNDYSGSPLVFKQALQALQKDGYNIHLLTATNSEGFLSHLEGVSYKSISYQWHTNKLLTLLHYLYAQTQIFISLLFNLSSKDIVYINTLLPFAAAIAGRLRGCKVIYHLHETSIQPKLLQRWLLWVADHCSSRNVFVSHYLSQHFYFKKAKGVVVYNSLPEHFIAKAAGIAHQQPSQPFTVLMLCSLKAYKGIYEFVSLAAHLPEFNFILVLNAKEAEVTAFHKTNKLSGNCKIYSTQSDTIACYKQAHMVVNLSRKTEWVETFGMTILEAMYCGKPVITPTVGGITELIQHGTQGFMIDSNDLLSLQQCIRNVATHPVLYNALSNAALARSVAFTPAHFSAELLQIFHRISIE